MGKTRVGVGVSAWAWARAWATYHDVQPARDHNLVSLVPVSGETTSMLKEVVVCDCDFRKD